MCNLPVPTLGLRAFAPSLFLLLILGAPTGRALDDTDIPADAPQDAVMAGPEEIRQMQDWAAAAFTGSKPPTRRTASRRASAGFMPRWMLSSVWRSMW